MNWTLLIVNFSFILFTEFKSEGIEHFCAKNETVKNSANILAIESDLQVPTVSLHKDTIKLINIFREISETGQTLVRIVEELSEQWDKKLVESSFFLTLTISFKEFVMNVESHIENMKKMARLECEIMAIATDLSSSLKMGLALDEDRLVHLTNKMADSVKTVNMQVFQKVLDSISLIQRKRSGNRLIYESLKVKTYTFESQLIVSLQRGPRYILFLKEICNILDEPIITNKEFLFAQKKLHDNMIQVNELKKLQEVIILINKHKNFIPDSHIISEKIEHGLELSEKDHESLIQFLVDLKNRYTHYDGVATKDEDIYSEIFKLLTERRRAYIEELKGNKEISGLDPIVEDLINKQITFEEDQLTREVIEEMARLKRYLSEVRATLVSVNKSRSDVSDPFRKNTYLLEQKIADLQKLIIPTDGK